VLGAEKEVIIFVKQETVEMNQRLPLSIAKTVASTVVYHFDALLLHHNKTSVNAFSFDQQALLRNRTTLGLLNNFGWFVSGERRDRPASWERVSASVEVPVAVILSAYGLCRAGPLGQ
jgi:Tfp pilus assembly protein PilF